MGAQLLKSESSFSFSFEGNNEIDATILSKTIHDMAELTRAAVKEEDPEVYAKLNVTAFRNGSFQVDFSTVCEVSETFFRSSVAIAGFALTVVGTVKGFLEIKKLLKGKKPKSVSETSDDMVQIENSDGQKITVPKSSSAVINNTHIDQLTINISNYAQEHNPHGGFSFSTPHETVNFSSDDVKNISKSIPIEEESICRRYKTEVALPIKKADILGRSAWEFIYNDRKISATMCDDYFMERVHKGEIQIKAGDYLKATLEIYVDIDLSGNPIENSEKYSLIKVHGNINNNYEQLHFPMN